MTRLYELRGWLTDNMVVVVSVVACMVTAVAIIAIAMEPSCEGRGGRLEYRGTVIVPMVVGKLVILTPQNRYECVIPRKK